MFLFLLLCALGNSVHECIPVGIASESPGIAARTLASIAEVLGAMSRGEGGLRSGPASNLQWEPAFQLLEVYRSLSQTVIIVQQL